MQTRDYWFGYCPRCFGATERRVDLKTGRCDVRYQARCKTRDACEKRILGAFGAHTAPPPESAAPRAETAA